MDYIQDAKKQGPVSEIIKRLNKLEKDNLYLKSLISSGGGDVVGPAVAVDGNLAVFDGVTGKLIKDGGSPSAGSADGWVAASGTWSYSSADSPTFVISVNADVTNELHAGMKVKLTQTTTKYFIITNVGVFGGGVTLVTVYGGTDYTLLNAAISNPYYSPAKAPYGFPLLTTKWTIEASDSSTRSQAAPVQNTWYNLDASEQISIPIGHWRVYYMISMYVNKSTPCEMNASLSTANNAESDNDFTTRQYASTSELATNVYKEKYLSLASKTLYYLIVRTTLAGTTTFSIQGAKCKTIIRAVCAYV